jgi:hypothetical protein
MFDVTIATHAAIPAGSTDDRLLAEALVSAGARVRVAVWNDPGIDWSLSTRTVIRSTWDYHLQPDAWFTWLETVVRHTILINDAATLRWNSDKRYLLDLQAAGVAIVPTLHLSRGTASEIGDACAERGWVDVVIKPAVGASAKGAERFTGKAIATAGRAHLDTLLATGYALVQPYQAAVEGARERSLVYLDGAFSHAFTKPPFLRGTGDGLGEQIHDPEAGELGLADRALAAAPALVTYARVDLVPAPDGPRLMELELIEPDLGLRLHAPAAPALARAILARSAAASR